MNLPEDIIVEILSRLPVKSLLRFKCVSRSWNAIINDPTFISTHHQTISSQTHYRPDVALISRRDNKTNTRTISLLTANDHDDTLVGLNFPSFLNETFVHVRLVGPCNGVLCLYGFPDNIALWNPSTRDFRRLPQSRVPRPHNSKVRGGDLGLGFDSKSQDLKVLQMLFCVTTDDCRIVFQVEIYSLRSDSWRKFNSNVPANIKYNNLWSMVFKNERFCWWAQDRDNVEVILSFDMGQEVFGTTSLPSGMEDLGGERRITRAILPRGEELCLIVYGQRDVGKVFDLWCVRELGGNENEGCWRKLMCIGPVFRVEKPLGFWGMDGIFLESSDGEMVLFNFVDGSMKNFGVYGKRSRLEVVVFKESLFSLRN